MTDETCAWREERGDIMTDEPLSFGEPCGKPAKWISCQPFVKTPTCDEHKCRCAKPIEPTATPAGTPTWLNIPAVDGARVGPLRLVTTSQYYAIVMYGPLRCVNSCPLSEVDRLTREWLEALWACHPRAKGDAELIEAADSLSVCSQNIEPHGTQTQMRAFLRAMRDYDAAHERRERER